MHKISFFISTVKSYTSLRKLLTILYLNNIGLAYLEAKGKEDGVVTLPSGLMYKEIRAGNGTFVKLLFILLQHTIVPIILTLT